MALQSSGTITARQIAVELGYTQGAETKIGDYRLNGGQDFNDGKILTIDNISAADGARKAGTYTDIDFSRSSGDGGGMRFTVIIDGSGAATISILDGGLRNEVGDQIEIDDNLLGSGGGATLTFDVATINTGVKLPVSDNVPTSGQIKFSDFYEARRTLVVDYFVDNENKPETAKDRFTGRSKLVVGGFIGNDESTSGKKVVVLVNKNIGSNKSAADSCALRTGTSWDSDTVLEILVGPNGKIIGAGGNGGVPRNGNSGLAGGPGTSGLGVQYEGTGGTRVTIQSGGRIAGGGGGGGAGGGARNVQERWGGRNRGPFYGRGGFGGGGAGLPAGFAISGGTIAPGTTGTLEVGGAAGTNVPGVGNFGPINGGPGNAQANGGAGAAGANLAANAGKGESGAAGGGESENPAGYGGGAGGAAGAAIRRNSGFTVVIQNLGPPSQIAGDTSATGIT